MTTEEAVQKIADAFADAETKAQNIVTRFRNTNDAWTTLNGNAVLGGLETQKHFRRMDALATGFLAELYVLHSKLTDRAKALGVDLPGIEGGGGR